MNAEIWKNLHEAERFLSARFATLRNSRVGPIFFIEHGLSVPELEQLRTVVRKAAQAHPIHTDWWIRKPLPLIVAATEAGYRYRGTGTDFWPKLESELEFHLVPEARRRIRDLFAKCSSRFRGARPPVSPWTQAFSLIAWPITHALVPVEFHGQLSDALANLQSSIQDLDDDELHRAVRIAMRRPSARFRAFLEVGSHAVPVIRALLGGKCSELSQSAVDRISLDLKADRDARINLEIARRRQARLRERKDSKNSHPRREALSGQLQLQLRENGRLLILVQFPTVHGTEAHLLRQSLRRHRMRHRLWGVTSPVPSDWLLSGLPFPINVRSIPDGRTPLLRKLDQLGIDTEQREILKRLRLDFRLPMLFATNATGEFARLVRGMEVSSSRVYWLLAEDRTLNTLDHLPRVGSSSPFICYRLDPSLQPAATELGRLGYKIRQHISVLMAGTPPLDNDALVPSFLVGDERVVVPRSNLPAGTLISFGSERIPLRDNLVRLRVTEGDHVLEISSRYGSTRTSFIGVQSISCGPLPPCRIELSAEGRTVQSLLRGGITLKVDSLAPMEGLRLSLELQSDTWSARATARLGPLPQVLTPGQEPWSTLLDAATRDRILHGSRPIVLRARVGHLADESWILERTVHACWWRRGPSGPILESELGPLKFGQVPFSHPASRPAHAWTHGGGEAILLAPLEPDQSIFGPTAIYQTYCTAPFKLPLQPPSSTKPRLRRSRWTVPDAVGVQDLTEAWLRWSLARSDNLTAEIRRQQASAQLDYWLAELTCGRTWALEERRASQVSADPWTLLASECEQARLGLDDLVTLSPDEENWILHSALAEIRRSHPDLWARVAPTSTLDAPSNAPLLDEDDYADLDAECARAYGRLAELLQERGNDEIAELAKSADPGAGSDEWDPVLRRTIARADLWTLGELLQPTDKSHQLMSLDLAMMELREIAEELYSWTRACRRALAGDAPTFDTVLTILALWISPQTAVSQDWQNALDTLVSERLLARAARYLAVRMRNIRPLEGAR